MLPSNSHYYYQYIYVIQEFGSFFKCEMRPCKEDFICVMGEPTPAIRGDGSVINRVESDVVRLERMVVCTHNKEYYGLLGYYDKSNSVLYYKENVFYSAYQDFMTASFIWRKHDVITSQISVEREYQAEEAIEIGKYNNSVNTDEIDVKSNLIESDKDYIWALNYLDELFPGLNTENDII